jgi:hypothetical protein
MTVISQLFYDPSARPLSGGLPLPLGYYNFYVSSTTTPTPVYQDAGLTTPFPATTQPIGSVPAGSYMVQADGTGTFPPIYLNPTLIYRVQLYNSNVQLQRDDDPIIPAFPVTGTGPISFDAQGEMTINAPLPGGVGVTLTIAPAALQALLLSGVAAGTPAMIINNAISVGTQTATFSATNKPGSGTTAPSKWLPIQCDGSTYLLPLWL